MNALENLMGNDLKILGSYSYIGEVKCNCDNLVLACLTVSAQKI